MGIKVTVLLKFKIMTLISPNSRRYKDFVPTTFSDIIKNFFKENTESKNISDAVLSFLPKVNIAETEKYCELNLLLAGIAKQDIKIDFQDDKLIVSGERTFEKYEEGKKFHKIETQFSSF